MGRSRGILNPKQLAFIDEYMTNGHNGQLAYRKCYPLVVLDSTCAVNASNLLVNPKVVAEIKKRKEKINKKFEITLESQTRSLLEIIQSCKEEGLDGKGTIKDRTNWVKAVQELNKLAGLITTKQEVKNITPIFISLNLDDEDIPQINTTNIKRITNITHTTQDVEPHNPSNPDDEDEED